MEHLDLAGYMTTPTNWNLGAFEQQDAIYLSNSRQMLEPIMEETSEDEEHSQHSWNQYEHGASFWSSAESETGSVIRVEVNKDLDAISERDFVCPPKRARRSDDLNNLLSSIANSGSQPNSLDDAVLLRRPQRACGYELETNNSLERFLSYEASCAARDSFGSQSQRSSTGSRRFDDYYSDSESYHSLSRSSSLIQFESLERQLLAEQRASMNSLGNSSPSLLGFDMNNSSEAIEGGARSGANSGSNSGNNSRRGSQSSLMKRYESTDGRLHQTYFELNKLDDFEEEEVLESQSKLFAAASKALPQACQMRNEVKSDSESSTSSARSSCSGNSILTASKPSAEDLTDSSCGVPIYAGGQRSQRIAAFHTRSGGKNSAENLSEDSGYCEPSTLRRAKSKSIPKNFEKFCEEDEEFQCAEAAVAASAAMHAAGGNVDCSKNTTTHSKNSNDVGPDVDDDNDVGDDDDVVCASRSQHESPLLLLANDLCQPKINDAAAFLLETSVDDAVSGAAAVAAATSSSKNVKNSATRAPSSLQHDESERRRALAHSPSPVSSDISTASSSRSSRSTRSASSDSAASFTWLPNAPSAAMSMRGGSARLANAAAALSEFSSTLRSSLPDIREVFGTDAYTNSDFSSSASSTTSSSEAAAEDSPTPTSASSSSACSAFSYRRHCCKDDDNNNEAQENDDIVEVDEDTLEQSKSKDRAVNLLSSASKTVYAKRDIDSPASPTTSSSSSAAAHSDATSGAESAESTPEARKRVVVSAGGEGGGGGGTVSTRHRIISSVPSELNKLGRKKRSAARHKHRKLCAGEEAGAAALVASDNADDSSSYGSSEDERVDHFDFESLKIRRSCSWSERRDRRNLQKFEGAFGGGGSSGGRVGCDTGAVPKYSQSLGYINASYHNLTLLDYTGRAPTGSSFVANHKRAGGHDDMESRKSTASADYEDIICKGNFLLDELSAIYDRNASILNDKPVIEEEEEDEEERKTSTEPEEQAEAAAAVKEPTIVKRMLTKPNVPPRTKYASSSEHSGSDEATPPPPVVQHVQLTIRRPPPPLPPSRQQTVVKSSVSPTQPQMNFSTFGKTFDQDPTNLRTSYAQSLEKCNFDANEVASTDYRAARAMPKRRFQTHAANAKKRNLVSSTPNLNAYDHGDDDQLEDDMYVSSAHTSMHRLPQSAMPKPLGILLPTGSRTSFGKEVSFCPVVSKYSWQEQSSEEAAAADEAAGGAEDDDYDEEDELLDNADATVIYNTKENEQIAMRYNKEQRERRQREIAIAAAAAVMKKRAQSEEKPMSAPGINIQTIVKERNETVKEQSTKTEHDNCRSSITSKPVSASTTAVAATVAGDVAVIPKQTFNEVTTTTCARVLTPAKNETNATTTIYTSAKTTTTKNNKNSAQNSNRPLSLQLPILSEPPTNRAHHILYASQQLLDRYQNTTAQEQERETASNYNMSGALKCKENEQLSVSATGSAVSGGNAVNNNNEMIKSKFKADEKHPSSKGFLTRFANGFRFSLRRKKKQQLEQAKQQQQQQQQQQQTAQVQTPKKSLSLSSKDKKLNGLSKTQKPQQQTADFVYIPLKGPLPRAASTPNTASLGSGGQQQQQQLNESIGSSNASTASVQSEQQQRSSAEPMLKTSTLQKFVTGKPPLPNSNSSAGGSGNGNKQTNNRGGVENVGGVGDGGNFAQSAGAGHAQYNSAATHALLDAERFYYNDFAQQLNTGMQQEQMQQQQQQYQQPPLASFASPSRASVSQKTQMFNQLSAGMPQPTMVTAVPVAVSAVGDTNAAKIGLIETNLDTQETIISGKTRSLMDIAGPQHKRYIVKRLNVTSAAYDDIDDDHNGVGHHRHHHHGYDDDDDDDDENGSIRIKSTTQAGGAQIASVRRPHKSMEFLLDKENQKNVLVCNTKLYQFFYATTSYDVSAVFLTF